jgi:DNA-binding CsgD family transcriptional regulator
VRPRTRSSNPPSTPDVAPASLRDTPLEGLTVRELQVAQAVAEGISNAEIAQRLGIQEQTVKDHLHTIFDKADVENRVQLTLIVVRETPPLGAAVATVGEALRPVPPRSGAATDRGALYDGTRGKRAAAGSRKRGSGMSAVRQRGPRSALDDVASRATR